MWKLDHVVPINPGNDGIVHILTHRTKTGLFKRAVSRYEELPLEKDWIEEVGSMGWRHVLCF